MSAQERVDLYSTDWVVLSGSKIVTTNTFVLSWSNSQ